jgi:hypothetical protein
VFQAKWKDKLPGTLGDTDLKKFVGTRAHFANEDAFNRKLASTTNGELKRLLTKHDVVDRIRQGYEVRQIFVANVTADTNGVAYIRAAEAAGTPLDVWDLNRLAPLLKRLDTEWFVAEPARLVLSVGKFFVDGAKNDPRMVVGAVPATELVCLPGMSDTRIFAQNVRLSLGKTRVNQEIEKSVRNKGEHPDFLSFHNGLTVVATNLKVRGRTLTMTDYSVCNGCQSLVTFFNNRSALTPNLEVMVRFVRVGTSSDSTDRDLAASIAYRTNYQHPVSLRDQSANDSTQIQLKEEFDGYFGEVAIYAIKRGVKSSVEELPNEIAGQLLLALYTGQPWSSHQEYRVFGNLYHEIFRYGISAAHIRLAQLVANEVSIAVEGISNERIRKYGLTRFVVLYHLGEVLRQEPDGVKLLDQPLPYLRVRGGGGEGRQEQVLSQIRQIAKDVIIELDDYLTTKGSSYDYKSEFKSPGEVKAIRSEVLKAYEKDKRRGRATVFQLPT